MRLQKALLLACAGFALLAGAKSQDDSSGNVDVSKSGGGKCLLTLTAVTEYVK